MCPLCLSFSWHYAHWLDGNISEILYTIWSHCQVLENERPLGHL